MDSRALALLLGLAVLGAAVASGSCEGEEGAGPGSPSPTRLGALELSFEVPSEVRAGEPVPFKLTVTNAGDEPLELGLRGLKEQGFPGSREFVIETDGGEQVARWRCGAEVFELVLSYRTLQPGEGLELGCDWDQLDDNSEPVAPGTYSVYGAFTAFLGSEEEIDMGSAEDIDMQTEMSDFVIAP